LEFGIFASFILLHFADIFAACVFSQVLVAIGVHTVVVRFSAQNAKNFHIFGAKTSFNCEEGLTKLTTNHLNPVFKLKT